MLKQVQKSICCRKAKWSNYLHRRFPCINHAQTYSWQKFVGDCIAGKKSLIIIEKGFVFMPPKRVNLRITFYSIGLTLALTVIPMGMGYAALAGLPLQVNVYYNGQPYIILQYINNFHRCGINVFCDFSVWVICVICSWLHIRNIWYLQGSNYWSNSSECPDDA